MNRFALTAAVMMAVATVSTPRFAAAQDSDGPAATSAVVDIEAPAATLMPLTDEAVLEAARLEAVPQDAAAQDNAGQDAGGRPKAYEYSDAYLTRAKIHKYASFATLPLLGTELWLGQSLYNDPQSLTSGKKAAHGIVGASLIGLFGLNSVTGLWNLVESSDAPGHNKRLVHGILMLVAEGGFVAAAVTAPGHSRDSLINFDANAATHRNIAYFSIGTATAGYLLMLFGGGH
jgi:hypothetical protein